MFITFDPPRLPVRLAEPIGDISAFGQQYAEPLACAQYRERLPDDRAGIGIGVAIAGSAIAPVEGDVQMMFDTGGAGSSPHEGR